MTSMFQQSQSLTASLKCIIGLHVWNKEVNCQNHNEN